MTAEERRIFREAAQVLLTLLRCISMKRALGTSAQDHLSFFRLYDFCLMDEAVLAWCKVFGSRNTERLHWERLFPESSAIVRRSLELKLMNASGGDLRALSKSILNYRNTHVAHHDLNEAKRAKRHPQLNQLQTTGQILYAEVFATLDRQSAHHGLASPDALVGTNLLRIESNWHEIVSAARFATSGFHD